MIGGPTRWGEFHTLAEVSLVSFDVFDTLLLRRVDRPAAVFEALGRQAAAAGLIDAGLSPPLFRLARQEAERRARARVQGGEVELAAIYHEMAVGDANALAALELEVEATLVYANPLLLPVLRWLSDEKKPVVFLSDMYFSSENMRWLLRGAGIGDDLYRSLYVSSGHRCSKRDGGLFKKLLHDHPLLKPEHILHIGDDPVGDVAMARAAGLRVLQYVPGPSLARFKERERSIGGLAEPPAIAHRQLVALAGREDPVDQAPWLAFGSLVLGPAVAEYCRWVVEDCHRRGIGVIAPLMREASLFSPLMTDWIRHRGYAMRVEPLHVSRHALAPLEWADLDALKARSILTAKPHLSWDRLLEEVGGAIPQDVAYLAGQTLDMMAGQMLPGGGTALEQVLRLFDDPGVRAAAAERARERQWLVLAHLAERLDEDERVALVDLGARGSTPAALARLLPDGWNRFHIYLCYGVPDLAGLLAEGLRVSVYAGQTDRGMAMGRLLYRSPQILERVLTGLSGTTLGYVRNGAGRCEPVCAPPPATGDEVQRLGLLQAGIRRYADLLLATHPSSGDAGLCAGDDALLPLTAALLLPTAWEAKALGRLAYDQNDGVQEERGICDAAAMDQVRFLAGLGDGPIMGLALGLRPAKVPWPQGALTCLDPGIFQRHVDAFGLDLGHGPVCRALVARLVAQGVRQVVVLAVGGDGGMGPDFIRMAREAGVEPVAYADLMGHLVPPPLFHAVPVLEIEALTSVAALTMVLVTLGYADRLAALARRQCAAAGRVPRLVALGRPDLEEAPAASSRTVATAD